MENTVAPYTLETDSSEENSDSDSSEDGNLLTNNLGVLNNKFDTRDERFMNQQKVEEYQRNRNKLFTPETYVKLITINVVLDDWASKKYQTFSISEGLRIPNTNIIGFKIVKSHVKNSNGGNFFTDLVIDEIPPIACDNNENGKSIITRVPLPADILYHPHSYLELSLINRYFYPRKIDKLTVSFLDKDGNYFQIVGTLTFEITYLNEKVHNG